MIVQGDVFFTKAHKVPESATAVARTPRGYIIAEGEATGHAHVVDDDVELYEKDGTIYLKTTRTVEVRHEEHKPVSLEAGTWQVGIVREYDPFIGKARIVED